MGAALGNDAASDFDNLLSPPQPEITQQSQQAAESSAFDEISEAFDNQVRLDGEEEEVEEEEEEEDEEEEAEDGSGKNHELLSLEMWNVLSVLNLIEADLYVIEFPPPRGRGGKSKCLEMGKKIKGG